MWVKARLTTCLIFDKNGDMFVVRHVVAESGNVQVRTFWLDEWQAMSVPRWISFGAAGNLPNVDRVKARMGCNHPPFWH